MIFSPNKLPISIYNEWIKSILPDNIPPDIIKKSLPRENSPYPDFVIGLEYYVDADPGRVSPRLEYVAKDETDLKCRIFADVAFCIASEIELSTRKEDELKWHYIPIDVKDNKWLYKENQNYIYDTIFDSRKTMFECHLKLLKLVYSLEQLSPKIKKYEKCMNINFQTPHWKFDLNTFEFVEISNSKEKNYPEESQIIKD